MHQVIIGRDMNTKLIHLTLQFYFFAGEGEILLCFPECCTKDFIVVMYIHAFPGNSVTKCFLYKKFTKMKKTTKIIHRLRANLV